ncbi:MAG: hypothetical protein IT430_01350 [Phycisphaerales bacterium]|nr:hypothetical protein [Phycisphaerales bacterium]
MSRFWTALFGAAAPLCLTAALSAQNPAGVVFDASTSRLAPVAAPGQANPQGEVLYDTLWITDEQAANAGIGNAIGGAEAFPSLGTVDSQLADDFHLDVAHQINTVIVDCQSYFASDGPDEGFWIQFYESDGLKPAEALYAEATVTQFTREYKGQFANFETYRYTLDLSGANIVLDAGDWWMDVQPLDETDGGWFWSLSVLDLNPPEGNHAHVRDGWLAHGNGYYGLWNSTVWIEHNFRGRGTPARRIEGQPSSALRLRIGGECPGSQSLEVVGATPNGIIAILIGFQTGSYTLPGGPCEGTMLGIGPQAPRVVAIRRADANGRLTLTGSVGTAACGKYLQAIDGATCGTTNVVQIN